MSSNQSNPGQACEALPPVFIDGYLTQRILKGDRPDNGYRANHLPEAVIPELDLITGYMKTYGKR